MNWFNSIMSMLIFLGGVIVMYAFYGNHKPKEKSLTEIDKENYSKGFSDGQSGAVKNGTSEAYLDGYSDGQKR